MLRSFLSRLVCSFALALSLAPGSVRAQTLIESSLESRFQLDLAVPQAALMRMMPAGWTTNIATQGAAKDANLRVIFIERLTINNAEGRPVGDGSNLLVYLTVPATSPTGENAQVVLGGLSGDPADVPGPFGVYLPARTHELHRMTAGGADGTIELQDWVFEAASGERLEMRIEFERGVANRGAPRDVRFHSAKDPAVVEISRQQQVLDILRNVTTNPTDRVRSFSFTAGGGSYAALFDGTERVLSWDNIVWLDRDVLRP
ncbi:MAG: hypothetical protein ABL963_03575 [Longimicrobiales bacterium]